MTTSFCAAACSLVVSISMLAGCADPAEAQRREEIQERELRLPIDFCIRHATGERGQVAELLQAGFSDTGDNRFIKEFSDLDNALSAKGSVSVIVGENCQLQVPIHIIALQEYGNRLSTQLSQRGFKPVGDARARTQITGDVPYTDGNTTISVNGFTTRGLTGMSTIVTIKAL